MVTDKVAWELWERIWKKSMAMASSYNNWKDDNSKGSVHSFSKRKDDLYKEFVKVLAEATAFSDKKSGGKE